MAASKAHAPPEQTRDEQCRPPLDDADATEGQQEEQQQEEQSQQQPNSSSPPSRCTDSPSHSVPPRTRYQLPFPRALETVFAPLDDALIAFGQRRTAGFVHLFAMSLTFFTSIEFALIAPPTLYALGYDAAAGLSASVLLVLGVISQVPKKFIFRPRPWMVGRALPIRRDRTSSFPSRAVVCAVVFSWLVGRSLELEGVLRAPLEPLRLWLGIVLMASLAAFARINVGAHYPSDTVLGFVLGCCVVKMGTFVESRWRGAGCSIAEAYPTSSSSVVDSWSDLQSLGWGSLRKLLSMTFVAYAMTLVSIQGFWVKCSYVYGLLMSSGAFRAAFLCFGRERITGRPLHGVARVIDHGSTREHAQAAATFAALLFFGMATRGRKGKFRIVAFTLIYVGTLLGILYWRLRPARVGVVGE